MKLRLARLLSLIAFRNPTAIAGATVIVALWVGIIAKPGEIAGLILTLIILAIMEWMLRGEADDSNARQPELEKDLREAIEQNRLHLEYQPIIDLRRNVVSGFEALARWRHPTRGLISPVVFIPLAEDSRLILPLGEWALREACSQAARWPDHLKIAVNLSPVQFSSPDLADTVLRILSETALDPHRLVLEITERLFITDTKKTLTTLHRLKALGVGIAMDDFGTGYSSLNSMRRFPFDTIKIDRAFVADLGENAESSVIVQAMIIIAGALGRTTVAEGVETAEQQRLLMALGCDEVQGFLFSPPVAIEKVSQIIAAWTPEPNAAANKIMAA